MTIRILVQDPLLTHPLAGRDGLVGRTAKGRRPRAAPLLAPSPPVPRYFCSACTISCVTFLASPNSIMVFGR